MKYIDNISINIQLQFDIFTMISVKAKKCLDFMVINISLNIIFNEKEQRIKNNLHFSLKFRVFSMSFLIC